LALRARLIQRKSIHSLSTGATLVACALVAALVVGGCAGGEAGTTPAGDRFIDADPGTIQVLPNDTGTARFVLTSGGVPIAAQPVTFSLVDTAEIPGDETAGVTLSDTSAVTDELGVATVDVHVSDAPVVHLRATAGSAEGDLVIIVAVGTGSVQVAPFFASNSDVPGRTLTVEVRLFDDGKCADINLAHPPWPPRGQEGLQLLAPSGEKTSFTRVSTGQENAVVGRGLDAHGLAIAVGCVDLFGSSLVKDGVVEVGLPLRDTAPSPVGRYAITSPLVFVPPLAAASSIAVPWRDLGDCPLDPAQMFLDCITDAFSPATADDPLDCKPKPGGEGALGDAFAARRGVPIVDTAGNATACRASRDAVGNPSLDAIAMGLFGTPTPALLVALPAIGNDAAHVLDALTLISLLDVQPTGRADEYVVSHTLQNGLVKGSGMAEARVDLSTLALPALTAFTTATARDGILVVDDHEFSLRLGRVARAGFGLATLMPLIPGQKSLDAGGLITEILKLAHSDDGASTACAAFDRVLCSAVGSAEACLAKACPDGLGALTNKLNSAFDAADGTGLDFTLSGSAPLLDTQGSGYARKLSTDPNDSTSLARWSVDLRTAAGRARLVAQFEGVRTN